MCPIAGFVPSTIEVWLDFALEVLLHIARKSKYTEFLIKLPTSEEIREGASLLNRSRGNGHFSAIRKNEISYIYLIPKAGF